MTEHKIRIEDHSGNIYYPHTKGDVVFTADGQSIEQKVNIHLAESTTHDGFVGGYKILPNFTNFNDLITVGNYQGVYSTAKINEPITTGTNRRVIIAVESNATALTQRLQYIDFGNDRGRIFYRSRVDGNWGNWIEIARKSELDTHINKSVVNGGVHGFETEKGSFTPSLLNGSYTYTAQVGRYIRQGNLVFVNIWIQLSSITTAGSGAIIIEGLPFVPAHYNGAVYPATIAEMRNVLIDITNKQVGARITSDARLNFQITQNNAGPEQLQYSALTSITRIDVSCVYEI
ncbi:pyocin knob domain-containing protein [Clostridium formicaceticum]|uniref:Uncharacterized protein n=1 Tax=Clostridium formicaceticum TaxID=1497 RepID=A0AAC9RK31_9CLOT|nr:pyocin knob domain-containing protein [Clostridium formicaceticum]AOY76694.1 hypothetical protein BJL90_12950 [Clostridium formicaceticum]ARE87127.1 hypothetical protein CLFO_15130 [Clostridium formicaceticum]